MDNYVTISISQPIIKMKKKMVKDRIISDFILALVLLVPASVVMLMVFILFKIKIKDNGTFFYRNYRIGKDKKPFYCLKIRTLIVDAEKKIGSKIYQGDGELDLWYGKFLRKTRIDELPQLINIIRGEMAFIGPRPVRPVQYEQYMAHIPGSEKIFSVRPGLTGYSQFLTPSGSDKRIRSRIDSIFFSKKITKTHRIVFILWTTSRCLYLVFKEIKNSITHKKKMIMNGKVPINNRILHREYPKNNVIAFFNNNNNVIKSDKFSIADINLNTMRILTKDKINDSDGFQFSIFVENLRNGNIRKNRVICTGKVLLHRDVIQKEVSDNTYCYIIQYEPKSTFHRYLIDKYILKSSIA